MTDRIDISEVARRTGLTLRALRFYEQRGIVRPLRSDGGRRIYGPGELARLNAAVALKNAGFSLSDIAHMLGDRPIDLGPMIAAQIDTIEARAAEIARARTLMLSVRKRLAAGEAIDVETLCALIRTGDGSGNAEDMAAIAARYLNEDARADFADSWSRVPEGFDQQRYGEAWRDLCSRIEAALPLDPARAVAQAFVDEWFALLKPFIEAASPEVYAGVARMYNDAESWAGEADAGVSRRVWEFIQLASAWRMTNKGEGA